MAYKDKYWTQEDVDTYSGDGRLHQQVVDKICENFFLQEHDSLPETSRSNLKQEVLLMQSGWK